MRRLFSLAILHAVALPATAQQLAERVPMSAMARPPFPTPPAPTSAAMGHLLMLHWLDQGPQQVVFFDQGMAIGSVDMGRQRCIHGPVRVQLSVREGQVPSCNPPWAEAMVMT